MLRRSSTIQSDNITLIIYFTFITRFLYRHSLESCYLKIKLEIKVHSSLLKHCSTTLSDNVVLFTYFILVVHFSFRHSRNSFYTKIRSEIKVHNLLVKRYSTTLSDKICLFIYFYLHCLIIVQTLNTLGLSNNQIGYQGAEYLAEALVKNTVGYHHFLHFYFRFPCRNSLHSTFTKITSEIKVQILLLKHY